MEKYYTPTIDEFHVGFEYEYTLLAGWRSNTFQLDSNIQALEQAINAGYIRVKYLDREDIESVGWGFEENLQYCDQFKYKSLEAYLWVIKDENLIEIQCEKTYFRGCIQNKSELKKLMKQLNIQTT